VVSVTSDNSRRLQVTMTPEAAVILQPITLVP
jgi:hypothetical protein